ncbi:MAG TPA: hypothetical protein VFM54_05290 [Micromonosporaceae bacterium]|nr:hypothetical protein [Micromonosporaceae bacterium]
MPIRFQVDPDFYDHPKTTGMPDACFALWVRAGSFCAGKATDGFVSEDVLVHTLRYDMSVADELVRRRLWRRVKGGYRFHEWDHRNLTKARVEADRRADRQRKARTRSSGAHEAGNNGNPLVSPGNVRPESARNPPGVQPDSNRIPGASVSVSVSESVSGSGRASPTAATNGSTPPEPPRTCTDHINDPNPPKCGPCAGHRRTHDRWQAQRAARQAAAPKCRTHRGQPAHNCALCRSEQLTPQESP